jgi:hypothetical protein
MLWSFVVVCLCFLKDTAGASRECYSDSLSACIIISGLFSILPVRWYDGHGLMEYFNCSIVKSRNKESESVLGHADQAGLFLYISLLLFFGFRFKCNIKNYYSILVSFSNNTVGFMGILTFFQLIYVYYEKKIMNIYLT